LLKKVQLAVSSRVVWIIGVVKVLVGELGDNLRRGKGAVMTG